MSDLNDRRQTLSSFDWQWAHLATGDFMPGDPWFDANAARVLATELCAIDSRWFAGKRVLDAGCGQGRWSRALVELGANVTAVDFSEAGLARTREICGDHPRLRTHRVDLLDIPGDLSSQRFDLVFSFGVLHHTGDTWRALDNIAGLVDDGGAMFLYLYGSTSWEAEERARIERDRRELAPLSFDEKIAELRRRYPGQDPHQLFDLLSPVINDRVNFDDVVARLRSHGFGSVVRTVAHSEVYLRATRHGFPTAAALPPVGAASEFVRENEKRWARRSGANFEASLRARLQGVRPRNTPAKALTLLRDMADATVFDGGLPPDRVDRLAISGHRLVGTDVESPSEPGALGSIRADLVLWLGASLGACRYPGELLLELWRVVEPGGVLLVELPATSQAFAARSLIDRVLDARHPVPDKIARMLSRHGKWCTGQALYAVGKDSLLNPILPREAAQLLSQAGAQQILTEDARAGTVLLVARAGT